ncbi:MAG: helix-turn-helix transcriptional regulator [Pseudomonadota bacterium]
MPAIDIYGDFMSFGDNLKRLRRDRSWTQGQLADEAGLRLSHIPKLERADSDPKLSTIYKLLNALECSTDTLLMDADQVGVDGRLKASLERLNGLPDVHKCVIIDMIDAYCFRNAIKGHFKADNKFKLMLFKDMPQGLVKPEELDGVIEE